MFTDTLDSRLSLLCYYESVYIKGKMSLILRRNESFCINAQKRVTYNILFIELLGCNCYLFTIPPWLE